MSWFAITMVALTTLFFCPGFVSRWKGRRCPNCKTRMRSTGQTHFVSEGSFPTWQCRGCGARYYGDQPRDAG